VTDRRTERLDAVLERARRFAAKRPEVAAVALVGSYARGTPRPDSDIDLVVLSSDPERLLRSAGWYAEFGEGATLVRSEDFGAIQERRLRLPDGLEIEVGIGRPSWASLDPLDDGTRRVVAEGLVSVHDPAGLLARVGRGPHGRPERSSRP
jgi:predicted nucleotidyltransferase